MVRIGKMSEYPDFTPLEEGWYHFTIESIKEDKDITGEPVLKILFITDTERKKTVVYHHRSKKWAWEFKRLLRAIDETLIDKEFDSDEILGKSFVGYVVQDGKYSKIKEYQPIDFKPEQQDEEEKFDLPF